VLLRQQLLLKIPSKKDTFIGNCFLLRIFFWTSFTGTFIGNCWVQKTFVFFCYDRKF